MKQRPLDLRGRRLVVCIGPGGVGKTTLSAAIALNAAIGGRSVDVMTVDPAPRLLDALGLDGDAAEPRKVSLAGLGARRGGGLRALKLDAKRMFDQLVERHAPSAAARDSILANRIYNNLSNALAGVADYMAMERLLDLYESGAGDLIVLDTPPARAALDFLDAPRRILELIGSRALTLLGVSGEAARGPLGMFDFAARAVLSAFDRLTGLRLLGDVQAFARAFDGMYAGFADRAARAQALIRSGESLAVLITSAEIERVRQAREFIEALDTLGITLGAIAVNRVMADLPAKAAIERAELPAGLRRKLIRNLADFAALKDRERAAIGLLRESVPPGTPLIIAPDFGREPRTLKDFARIAAAVREE
jgi:anion-transporting  ArsA/GET3 family ATPase